MNDGLHDLEENAKMSIVEKEDGRIGIAAGAGKCGFAAYIPLKGVENDNTADAGR